MYSAMKIFVFVLLATSVLGISIGKSSTQDLSTTSSNLVTPNANNGFAVQTGYEGYILTPQKASANNIFAKWLVPSKINLMRSIILPASSFLTVYGAKIVYFALHLVLALLLGVAATTAACTFTPICSFSLATPMFSIFKGQAVKDQVADVARMFMTPENVEMVSKMVQSAIDKYALSERREVAQPAPTAADNETTSDI